MKFEEQIHLLISENEVPDRLSPENIALMLKQKTAEKNTKPSVPAISMNTKKQALRFRSSAAVAACVALTFGIVAFVNDNGAGLPIAVLSSSQEARTAENYADVYKAIHDMFVKNGSMITTENPTPSPNKGEIIAPSDSDPAPAANTVVPYEMDTGLEEGIAQADILKTDGKNLYYAANNTLYVVSTENGKMTLLSKLATDKNIPAEIYIEQNRLIVLSNNTVAVPYEIRHSETTASSETTTAVSDTATVPGDSSLPSDTSATTSVTAGTTGSSAAETAGSTSKTGNDTSTETKIPSTVLQNNVVVEVYDITDSQSPKLVTTYKQNGSYISSRMIDSTLYLVSNYSGYQTKPLETQEDLDNYVPSYSVNGNKAYVEAKDIIIPPALSSTSYSVVSGLNIMDAAPVASVKAVLGNVKEVYSSSSALYLVGNAPSANAKDNSLLTRFGFNAGTLEYTNSVTFPGTLISGQSLNEYNGNLQVASVTTGGKSGKASAGVYIFGADLKSVGSLTGLSPDKEVSNVRFEEDKAYILQEGDQTPLVVSITNPQEPQLQEGASGSEAYLRNYAENRKLGLGREYNADGKLVGLKLTMFDSSTAELKELYSISISGDIPANLVGSAVDANALLLEPSAGLIGVPTVSQGEYGYRNLYSLISYDEAAGFASKGALEYNDVDAHYAFSRGLHLGDALYAFSGGRVVSAQLSDLKVIETLALK